MTSSTRKPLVAGNWKMHGALSESRELVAGLVEGTAGTDSAEMLLCPPFVYLAAVADWTARSSIELGAQDISVQLDRGAFTGEVAGRMLADVGCGYVIVGHSERRSLFGDTDARVAEKFKAAQAAGLTPILCVGETLEEREAGHTEAVVERQLAAVLDAEGAAAFGACVVAYEPVWAIGTGRTATPEQAQEMHAFIRGLIRARDATIANGIRILYGGSVNAGNAGDLLARDDIDGGLVGGASLKAPEFLAIFRAAAEAG